MKRLASCAMLALLPLAACAPTSATATATATAAVSHGLKQVHDPGHVTGTLTGHCAYRDGGQLPDPRCTPGSIDPAATQADIHSTICRYGYTKTVRPPEAETEAFKYDIAYPHYGTPVRERTELDHLVPLELGGSNDAANLWPEAPPTPNPKDNVEDALNHAVCSGHVSLAAAQKAIASDWLTAEKKLGLSPRAAAKAKPRRTSTPAVSRTAAPPPPPPPATSAHAAAPSTSSGCYPLTSGGNCYKPGEYCRSSDHGTSGVAGDGERIVCEDSNGWRWEPA